MCEALSAENHSEHQRSRSVPPAKLSFGVPSTTSLSAHRRQTAFFELDARSFGPPMNRAEPSDCSLAAPPRTGGSEKNPRVGLFRAERPTKSSGGQEKVQAEVALRRITDISKAGSAQNRGPTPPHTLTPQRTPSCSTLETSI